MGDLFLSNEEISNFSLWIQVGLLFVTALGVIATIIWNNLISRRRATLDLLLKQQTDVETVKHQAEFTKLRDAGDLVQWARDDSSHEAQAAVLGSVLNKYELISIGIQNGMIDEKTYKQWYRTTYVRDWIECEPYITQIRLKNKTRTFYCEFEKMAKKWANEDEKKLIASHI